MKTTFYRIPVDTDDEFFLKFLREFEKKYPKFKIIKNFVKKISFEHITQMIEQDVVMLYLNNKIYISPTIRNEEYLKEGLLHEIGHILLSRSEINDSEQVKDEFFLKRKLTLQALAQDYKVPQRIQDLFKNLEVFSPELDNFLNKIIGYDKLTPYISGYFLDPYALSSFDEYLATGFEMYLSEYRDALKKTNPILFRELDGIIKKL